MANPKLKRTDDTEYVTLLDDFAPKTYSLWEHLAMGGKLILVIGFLGGLLWLLNAITAK